MYDTKPFGVRQSIAAFWSLSCRGFPAPGMMKIIAYGGPDVVYWSSQRRDERRYPRYGEGDFVRFPTSIFGAVRRLAAAFQNAKSAFEDHALQITPRHAATRAPACGPRPGAFARKTAGPNRPDGPAAKKDRQERPDADRAVRPRDARACRTAANRPRRNRPRSTCRQPGPDRIASATPHAGLRRPRARRPKGRGGQQKNTMSARRQQVEDAFQGPLVDLLPLDQPRA